MFLSLVDFAFAAVQFLAAFWFLNVGGAGLGGGGRALAFQQLAGEAGVGGNHRNRV
jgi:hypothetical protein